MSTEEKAKAYDSLIERLKDFQFEYRFSPFSDVISDKFPELIESEDERIRKELLEHCKNQAEPYIRTGNKCPQIQSWITWLEKQDSLYEFEIKCGHWYKCVCDYMLNSSDLMFKNDSLYYCRRDWRLRGEIDEINVKDIGVNGYKSFFRPATNKEIKDWLEKQGDIMNYIYDKELSELLHIVICRYINDPYISYSDREKVSMKVLPYVELLEKQGKGIDYANKEYWRGYREGKQEILDKYSELEKYKI